MPTKSSKRSYLGCLGAKIPMQYKYENSVQQQNTFNKKQDKFQVELSLEQKKQLIKETRDFKAAIELTKLYITDIDTRDEALYWLILACEYINDGEDIRTLINVDEVLNALDSLNVPDIFTAKAAPLHAALKNNKSIVRVRFQAHANSGFINEYLVEYLAHTLTVKELDLSSTWNRDRDKKIKRNQLECIAKVLRFNRSIESLDLADQPVEDEGLILLLNALTDNPNTKLKYLNLFCTGITGNVQKNIYDFVFKSKTLKCVNARFNWGVSFDINWETPPEYISNPVVVEQKAPVVESQTLVPTEPPNNKWNKMKVNISGLDQAKLLVALVNNAKKSERTINTQARAMGLSNEEFVYMNFISEIKQRINAFTFTEKEAAQNSTASKNGKVILEYIGVIPLFIEFDANEIDFTVYNSMHCTEFDLNVQRGEEIVKQLKQQLPKKAPTSVTQKVYQSEKNNLEAKSSSSPTLNFLNGSVNKLSSTDSTLSGARKKTIQQQIEVMAQDIFHPSCKFWDSSLGLDIAMPDGMTSLQLQRCAELLKSVDIIVVIKPQGTFSAELRIQKETVESLYEKLNTLQQKIIENLSEPMHQN